MPEVKPEVQPLPVRDLCRRCDLEALSFATTDDLSEGSNGLGQERAFEAIRFAIGMNHPGYNLFVLGEPGSGRRASVRRLLEERAAAAPPPSDWCYLNNFAEANRPRLLQLPAGRGLALRRDMQKFVGELAQVIASAFESDEYRSRIEAIQQEFKEREEGSLQALGQEAMPQGVALLRTPNGFAFAPVKGEETMAPAEFEQLPEEERKRIAALIESLGEKLERLLHQLPRLRREMQARIKQVSRDTMSLAAGHLIEELKERYADLGNVLAFLDEVLADVVETGEELRESQKSEGEAEAVFMTGTLSLQRYQVNLLVEHGATDRAPVIAEDNPSYPNLIGRVDNIAHLGTLVTNFTLIRAGALHQANGGYLMLDALKVLSQPYAWEGLKRALRSGQIRIESLGQVVGWVNTLALEPEPIPLDLKVVLFGERYHYYLLAELDPDFEELFKVAADFSDEVPRTDDSTRHYARLIATLARGNRLLPFDRAAVGRLIEQGARIAGDAERITLRTRRISNLMRAADHLAAGDGRAVVGADDVERAVMDEIRRADRLPNQIRDEVLRGTLLIDTDGSHVGQVNGLAVFELSQLAFAHPVRISATARLGEGDIIDIERESELGGAIHSKGVMILTSFLAARYARTLPLSLAASIVFEQSYGPVEGDSASLAELCALLSALAGAPIKQSLALTGSVNQYGVVQAIGAVNEKIEGFFDVCRLRGLTGSQGVVIPEANVKHLMLRRDVVEAAERGQFHVYAVRDVDQAIALLTGVAAGVPNEQGVVPEGSINYLVATELAQLSLLRQDYAASGRKKRKKRGED